MSRARGRAGPATLPLVRCAVYTRKSTEEGLEQEFNTLDAQRESAEAFVRSQAAEGWTCLPDCYDDGGFTGGNMERPALRRLLADVAAGKVDCVVVYKLDRLSRSLLDFARMMQVFEEHRVAFVSVTQQFHTATSMGRLVLNVLLSFAQFEREIIAERTRDKVAATRRKGKWTGGTPPLGYDLDPRGGRLVVNAEEAARVREVFELYQEHEALLPVVRELARRGWVNKRRRTQGGRDTGGLPFDKTSLHRLLTNVLYAGRVRYKDEVHGGEQPALVEPETFDRAQELLGRRAPEAGPPARGGPVALLKGLLRCACCGRAMTPAHTTRKGARRYRYYVCTAAQKRGWDTCPSKAVPAAPIEQVVVGQLRALGRDRVALAGVLAQVRAEDDARLAEVESERVALERESAGRQAELRRLPAEVGGGADGGGAASRLAELQQRVGPVEERVARLRLQADALRQGRLDEAQAARGLAGLDAAWGNSALLEQARLVRLLVERVDYDGSRGRVAIAFRPTGFKTLAGEQAGRNGEELVE
jgi:site-specific DNA recombinase